VVLITTLALAATSAGCGGSVVKDDDGGGGSGGAGSGATGTTSTGSGPSGTTGTGDPTGPGGTTVTTGTGGASCDDHQDCPGGLCGFSGGSTTGTCIQACGDDGTCGPGLFCDDCATASCGPCGDCLQGCVMAPPHTCDSHDDCGDSETCVFATGTCSATCGDDVGCIDGFVCDDCATSSCPGCEACRPACVPAPPPGGCTDHEDCGEDLLCVYGGGFCTAPCEVDDDCGSKAYCDPCLTSSCPGCDDCLGGCVYLP
jgi:hypothetical protein